MVIIVNDVIMINLGQGKTAITGGVLSADMMKVPPFELCLRSLNFQY
jgi:hypothetical protein